MTPEIVARWHVGMTLGELRQFQAASRRYRIAKEREFARSERMIHAVMEEARRLTAARTDIPRPGTRKPRLEAYRAKLRLIEAKRQPAPGATKSEKPRIALFRARLRSLENGISRRDERDRAR
jgi:hypothetical protein